MSFPKISFSNLPKIMTVKIVPVIVSSVILTTTLTACAKKADSTTNSSSASNSNIIQASTNATSPQELQVQLQTNLKKAGVDALVTNVRPTSIPDLYWVDMKGLPSIFASKDGKYIIQGDVIQLGDAKVVDVSAALKQADAKAALASIPQQDMIVFKPKGKTKAVAYVFTDADCGYCRKLHNDVPALNAKGIEVRYLAWPRSPQSLPVMESVWCSKDRQGAMTAAKNGGAVLPATCANPVMQQHDIGAKLGVNGTPAIYTVSGEQIGGYVPVDQFAQRLGL